MQPPVIIYATKHLRIATFTFVTFLYAAAIHLVLHAGHVHGLHASVMSSAVLLVIVIFILADWLSRTRLPALVRDRVSVIAQIIKTILDLVCLYLLLFSALTLVDIFYEPHGAEATTYYYYVVCFLVATFIWNLHMFFIMKGIEWTDLAWATVRGNTLQLDATSIYGKQYLAFRDSVAQAQETKKIALLPIASAIAIAVVGDLIPQFVALHLSFGNLLLGGVLLLHAVNDPTQPLILLSTNSGVVAAKLNAFLLHPVSAIFFGIASVIAVAAIHHARRGKFWLWFLIGLGILGLLMFWPILQAVRMIAVALSAAAFVPGVCYLLSSEKIDLGVPPAAQKAFRLFGSATLVLEYIFLLVIMPAALLPAIAVVQHFAINFILQYAATPVASQYKRGLDFVRGLYKKEPV